MERAGQSLWSALRRVARPDKPLDLLVAVWPLMVGRRLADHTRPVAWSKGRVDVAVDQPEWQSQLESMGKDVRKQVNKWWGSELVREVRFVPEKAKRAEIRKSKLEIRNSKVALPAGRTPAENKLRSVLKELEPALKGIADADLRELVARVAGQYLAKSFGSAQDKQAKK
jgi:predicted nucleic acid-binding Zn ribbon protein